jgi:hypothetical protein
MNRNNFLSVFLFFIFTGSGLYGICPDNSESVNLYLVEQDTLKENQLLYIGREWRNLYYRVVEDQFLFSKELLTGSVTINSKSFKNIRLRYDIYNDEIMTLTNHGSILQLNKEMVDSFTIIFGNKEYRFTNITEDSLTGLKGYINVIYKGKSALYVKYKKEIEILAVDGKYDLFLQTHRIYFLKDGFVYQIKRKSDLFKVLNNYKAQIRNFIKKNKLKVSKKEPESFIPVIEYYDSISL